MSVTTKNVQNTQAAETHEEETEKEDCKDITEVIPEGADQVVMDKSHIHGIISKEDVDVEKLEEDLETYSIKANKKSELDRELTRLSTKLKERYGYSINIDRAMETIWNLEKADLFGSAENITAYFLADDLDSFGFPVFFEANNSHGTFENNFIVLAPKLDSD